jgi:anti-anti-sigma factor
VSVNPPEQTAPEVDKRVIRAPDQFALENADRVWTRLHLALEWNSVVLLDMSGCSFLDSTGGGVILHAARELERRQSRLGIVGLADQPRQMVGFTSLSELSNVLIFDSELEARRVLGLPSRVIQDGV